MPKEPLPPPPTPPPTASEHLLRLLTRLGRFGWDFAGLFFLALALMTLLGLLVPQLASGLLTWWAARLYLWLGWGSFWFVLGCGLFGLWLFRHNPERPATGRFWFRVLALEAAALASLALLSVSGGLSVERAEASLDGGEVGWGLARLLQLALQPLGLDGLVWQGLCLSVFFLIALFAGLGLSRWTSRLGRRFRQMLGVDGASSTRYVESSPVVSEAPLQNAASAAAPGAQARRKLPVLPPQFRKSFRLQPDDSASVGELPPRDERLPGLDLLVNEQFNRPDERNINLTAGLIEKTLADFGIPAKVISFRVGPTVTQFAVEPGYLEKEKNGQEGDANRQKVRVAQISSLGRDLALALAAERLRIEAPVPGRPYVGIEVPNARSTIVRMRPVLESEAFYKTASPLAIALGRDVSGQAVVADLSRMPHLLIAGTTGSGKSVCIAALTACLVMNNTPADLRLVMIDPKMVELVRFNGLPHLYGKVETDLERILAVLRWTVAEMDRRYKVLEASRSRNLDTYNRKARRHKGVEPLPRIVVMIDELADLMMSAPDQTEHNLVRLAQMARATGIHLVVATQRPGVDVVTGLIKANFPSRIAFTVASSVDSRVILDINGAETLLGRGDMLYLPPEASGPVRLQGVMISDQEIERLITFWQKAWNPPEQVGAEPSPWEELIANEQGNPDRDGLVERAVEIVRQSQHASASLLQRRLHIGYPRAARLVDELEEMGVIGPATGGGREREVLIDREDQPDEDF
jgi:DNA segregation ATPase FtsK/SpoIIIE, S-DNA-T family